jgi:hypothetical protein
MMMHGLANFTHPVHFAAGEKPQYALNRELIGPHSWYGCFREEKNLLFVLVREPPFLSCPAHM